MRSNSQREIEIEKNERKGNNKNILQWRRSPDCKTKLNVQKNGEQFWCGSGIVFNFAPLAHSSYFVPLWSFCIVQIYDFTLDVGLWLLTNWRTFEATKVLFAPRAVCTYRVVFGKRRTNECCARKTLVPIYSLSIACNLRKKGNSIDILFYLVFNFTKI